MPLPHRTYAVLQEAREIFVSAWCVTESEGKSLSLNSCLVRVVTGAIRLRGLLRPRRAHSVTSKGRLPFVHYGVSELETR